MRTRIKICGLTRVEDVKLAAECGVDAFGFIFVPNTPRFVGVRPDAQGLLDAVPAYATAVAVCRSLAEWETLPAIGFGAIQYYEWAGISAPPAGIRHIPCLRVRDRESLAGLESCASGASALLLDAYSEWGLGGTGAVFAWDLALEAKRRTSLPIILAGGLTPENVSEAVRTVRPYAVDVSSGVETTPGVKDLKKLEAFVRAVQETDRSLYA